MCIYMLHTNIRAHTSTHMFVGKYPYTHIECTCVLYTHVHKCVCTSCVHVYASHPRMSIYAHAHTGLHTATCIHACIRIDQHTRMRMCSFPPPGAAHAQSCLCPRSPSQAAWRMDLAAPLRVALPGFGLGSTASACTRPPNSLRWLFSPLPQGGKPICSRLPWTQGLGCALLQAGNPWSRCPQGSSLPSECVARDAPAALLHLSG